MSDQTKTGGSAFPIQAADIPGALYADPGMTLRDWFAGQALTGMSAYSGSYGTGNGPGNLAARAYEIADAMLAAREAATPAVPSEDRA